MEPPHSTSDAPFLRSSAHEGSKLMTKARKTSNRREDMAAHYAFGPSEDDVIIRQRLLTRTTTTRGEPPLKKLLKKFLAFAGEVEKNTDNVAECEKMYKSLLQELSTFELPLLKTRVVIDANVREQQNFQVLQEELDKQILQAHKDIEDLKVQLEESKVERQHKEECETIRRLIAAQPPRAETQKALNELNKEISSLETENTNANRTVELRKKQFSLLLYAIDSLQSTLDEEQTNNTEQESSIIAVLPTEATNTAEPMCIETT